LTDQDPCLSKNFVEGCVEPAVHNVSSTSGNCNEWGKDSLQHNASSKFIVSCTFHERKEECIAILVTGVNPVSGSKEHFVKVVDGAAWEVPSIDQSQSARLGGDGSPFSNEFAYKRR
jgi:hypothetical protein